MKMTRGLSVSRPAVPFRRVPTAIEEGAAKAADDGLDRSVIDALRGDRFASRALRRTAGGNPCA
jgi:hypothetical protein